MYYGWRPNLPDEGDNHLVGLAVAARACVTVTGNTRHLKVGELKFPAIRVLNPKTFLQELKS